MVMVPNAAGALLALACLMPGLNGVAAEARPPASDSRPWFRRCLVGMEVGPTGAQFGNSDTNDVRYAAEFDGGRILRQVVAAGGEYVVIWARDGDYAYYDSKLALKCPGLGQRDPLAEKVLADHVRSLRPVATVDFNYHGNPPFSWEVGQRPVQHAGNGDFVTGETGVWGFSALTVGLNAAWYRAATSGLPVQVAMQRGVHNWVRLGAEPGSLQALRGSIPADWPFLVRGPAVIYEATTAAPFGQLLKPSRTRRQLQGREGTEWPMSAAVPVGPAVLVNHVGQGVVLTFACGPDSATASEHAIVEARKLIRNSVRYLEPEPPIEITAPVNVETVVSDDAVSRVWRIHWLGYFSPPQTTPVKDRPYVLPGLLEDTPSYRATIRSVSGLNASTEIKRDGNRVELVVSEVHEVLQVAY
jgi:hypothetical protein